MRIANRAGAVLMVAALLTLIFVAYVFRSDADRYAALDQATEHVHAIVDTARTGLSALKDAETGQRGFLITGDEEYLEPYHMGLQAYEPAMAHLRDLTGNDANAQAMSRYGDLKTRELAAIIALFRSGGPTAAQARVRLGAGKEYMDRFRDTETQLVQAAEVVHAHNSRQLNELAMQTRNRVTAAAVILFLFTLTGTLLLAAEIQRERQITARLEASEASYRALAATLEEQVEARTQNLKELNSELASFSYSVSHDLRAPLRSIDGFSQMVLEDYSDRLDPAGVDMLQRVRSGARRMGELIQSLLDLSRVTRAELDLQPVSVTQVAERILKERAEAEPARKVSTIVEPGLTVNADAPLLTVVLENLLANAWKFTAQVSDARIEVGLTEEGWMFVKDNGAGFDSSRAARLFTPFQRFHSSSQFEGTGIGLATVQRIVNRHGGSIRAESKPGQGATFFFTV